MEKINPDALAESGDVEQDERSGVQKVTEEMILDYVAEELHALPPYSARPFAEWLDQNWGEFNEDGTETVGSVIAGALADWRGGLRY
ncbi:hypothetical protein [Streptomyces mirabilis]|uniref:hypothetical protein n=1 Tax=Streptomyces mirabilis TaxID=68239 RepID=UPI0036B225B8